jgi:hypothetical protein
MQYFAEAPLAAITALSLLGYDTTSLAHLYLGNFSFSADPLKLCQVFWGASMHRYFQASPETFDRVQVRSLAGPLKDIQRLLQCLGCVLRVVVLLEGELSRQSEVLSTLVHVFIRDLSVLCSVHLSLNPD